MDFDAPETIQTGGDYLDQPGTYHFAVNHVWEGTGPKGGVIDGFCLGLQVLAGTTEGQEEKELNLTFFSPNLNHKEFAQRLNRERQAAALVAMNLMRPDQLGTRVSIDLAKGTGSQVIATVETNDYGERSGLQLRFSDIYHVDDPRAKAFPRNKEALALIPPEKRQGPAYFEKIAKQRPGSNGLASSVSPTQQQLADL